MSEPRCWFPAKRYGWAWGLPQTWEGSTVLAVYAAVFIAALTVALIAACGVEGRTSPMAMGPQQVSTVDPPAKPPS